MASAGLDADPSVTQERLRSVGRGALMLLAFWALAFIGRVLAGAPDSSFGAWEDEPAHLVTGLMVRDFLAQGDYSDPVGFARDYYVTYPKVAFGQWPPVVHLVLGLWTLVLGDSRLSLILLTTLVAGLGALMTRSLARATGIPRPIPFVAGLLFLALPPVQEYSGLVMTEGPLAMTCGLAVLGFARLLERDDNWGLFVFVLGSVSSLLIKGLAMALAFLPLLAIPIAWRWGRLGSRRMWLSGVIIGALTAPWHLSFYETSTSTWSGGAGPSIGYAKYALTYYPRDLVNLGGPVVLIFAIFGMVAGLLSPGARARWAVYLAWLVSVALLLILVPSSVESRHLILIAPVLAAASISGAWVVSTRISRRHSTAWTLGLSILAFIPVGLRFPTKHFHGFEEVAKRCVYDAVLEDGPFLVASDAAGEGMLVSEFLLARGGPGGGPVLRASKVLGTGNWLGRGYQPRFSSAQELHEYLISLPVAVLVIDTTTKPKHWFEHFDQLLEVVHSFPDSWREVARIDVQRNEGIVPGGILLYELIDHAERPRQEITYDMSQGSAFRQEGPLVDR